MQAWDSRLARWLVTPLRDTRVHPNHVTTVGTAVGLSAAALYASGVPALVNLGAGVWVVSAVLDHADGELARMAGKSTAWGAAYDRASDLLVRLALFTAMGVGLRDGALGPAAPLCGLAAGVAFVAIFTIRGAIIRRRGRDAVAQPTVGGFEIEDVLYLIAPLTWLGGLEPFVVAAGIGAPLYALWAARSYRLATAPAAVRS
jgi:CDP-alcohol phosphatidyltransferase-like enzyme